MIFPRFSCRYVKGFITRNGAPTDDNRRFIRYMKYNFLTTLRAHLPVSVLDKSWPKSPAALTQVSLVTYKLQVTTLSFGFLWMPNSNWGFICMGVVRGEWFNCLNKRSSMASHLSQSFINGICIKILAIRELKVALASAATSVTRRQI